MIFNIHKGFIFDTALKMFRDDKGELLPDILKKFNPKYACISYNQSGFILESFTVPDNLGNYPIASLHAMALGFIGQLLPKDVPDNFVEITMDATNDNIWSVHNNRLYNSDYESYLPNIRADAIPVKATVFADMLMSYMSIDINDIQNMIDDSDPNVTPAMTIKLQKLRKKRVALRHLDFKNRNVVWPSVDRKHEFWDQYLNGFIKIMPDQ